MHIPNRRYPPTFVFIQWIPQELGRNHRTLEENCFSFPDAPSGKQTFTLRETANAPLSESLIHARLVPAEQHKSLQKLPDDAKKKIPHSRGSKQKHWLMLDCISCRLLTTASCQTRSPAPRLLQVLALPAAVWSTKASRSLSFKRFDDAGATHPLSSPQLLLWEPTRRHVASSPPCLFFASSKLLNHSSIETK